MAEGDLFDPLSPAFYADPYPAYRRLRETDPVWLSPLGLWILTGYDDCVMSLRDPRFGRDGFEAILSAQYGEESEPGRLPRSMLFRDPPDHTRLRSLVNRAFTPRVIEGMREQIEGVVHRLLDRVQGRGQMDVIADLAYPLPVTVICDMLGVPVADHEQIRAWSSDTIRSLDAIGIPSDPSIIERGRAGRRGIAEYFRGLLPERRRHPRADLLSSLIAAEEQGDRLTEGELLATCVLLFIAGHETTVNLIGNGLLALLQHPDQLERLRREPGLISRAVEELLRFDSPVQRTARITNAEVELGGKTIPKGAFVVTAIGAANRDPAHFPDPDRLDIARADNRHIAFGFGIHFCLGAPLARVEGQLAIGALLERMPRLRLAGPERQWRESSTLRGLKALPVVF
ncbi:MAG TPA: cytochrome P450 [Candidatus Nitrosotalea sp.]|nr:cytochrome P450 [Candidatus Nitrosotalea sp.]